MRKLYKPLIAIMISLVLSIPVFAGGEIPEVFDEGGNDVPIDGGLSLLLAAGAGYVGKKAYDAKKKKAQKDKELLP